MTRIAIVILFCFFIPGCKSSVRVETPANINPNIYSNIQGAGSFIGTWYYGYLFFSCKLIIDKNGTFSYKEETCNDEFKSYGDWTSNQNALILKSTKHENKSHSNIFMSSKQVNFNHEKLIIKNNTLTLFDYSGKPERIYVRVVPYSFLHYPEPPPLEQITLNL